jgi:predicted Zn-ribbon and HTH transcriptional regulator
MTVVERLEQHLVSEISNHEKTVIEMEAKLSMLRSILSTLRIFKTMKETPCKPPVNPANCPVCGHQLTPNATRCDRCWEPLT